MKTFLSSRARRLKPSATLAIAALEKEMRGRGIDVVGFGAGEPDFPTPSHIRDAAKRSLDRGETFYTPVGGTPDLKKAVAHRVREDYGLDYKAEEILVSCGAKHCLSNVFQAVLDPGDEAIVLAPYWVSYPEMIELADAVPIIVPTREEDLWVPDPKAVEARITPRTKVILVNSPSNPTGVLYPPEVMAELARIAEKHDLLVISDEIYDKLTYDGGKFTPFAALPGMKDRTILINGVSKSYAMTGFRIGYLASTRTDIVKAATNIQSQSTSNPSSTAQAAAVEALTGPQDEVARMVEVFERRRNLMVEEISKIEGLSMVKPGGAFYAFVNTSKLYRSGKVSNSADLARYLLEKRHVACVPGGPFGSEDHVRLSFATGEETIIKGLERLREVCQELL